jgi:hypothetical protein
MTWAVAVTINPRQRKSVVSPIAILLILVFIGGYLLIV